MASRCRTGKRKYRDEIAAKFALARYQHTDGSSREKVEQRVYRCPTCHAFHLTSLRR